MNNVVGKDCFSVPGPVNGSDWWRGAVIYQIYVRSYQDSNDDGVGDLRGIIGRLPYVASLGVDAIWLSPFFKSPMHDFGYDISDYRDVAPELGTLEEFDELLAKAHALGMKVMIDLALSHTSDEHPWFRESRMSRESAKANWYVWADPRPDGTPPNNWLSIFGGVAWEWDGTRRQYYLHNFLTSQPDLNFNCPEVQEATLDVVEFWLARGVDGFRLDTINFYFCDSELRSNPPLTDELRNDTIAPNVNPYNFQLHLFDKNRPENIEFLKRLRNLLDRFHGRMAMGEVGDAQRGMDLIGEYTRGESLVHSCYAFDFLSGGRPSAERVREILGKASDVISDGWASWAFSNHDVQRHTSRWDLTGEMQRLFTTMIMCMRGSVCVYQGEEIGLPEAVLNHKDLRDPYGVRFWPEFNGRDGCRTPMIWQSDRLNGGFSNGEPWLPVPDEHMPLAVAEHEKCSASLLHHYRWAIALRKSHAALRNGSLEELAQIGSILSFIREWRGQSVFCAFNLGPEPEDVELPEGIWAPANNGSGTGGGVAGKMTLSGWEACVALPVGE